MPRSLDTRDELLPTDPPSPTLDAEDRPPGVWFWIEEPEWAPRRVFVPTGARARVGRSPGAEVPLADQAVSRFHALLCFDGRTVTVADHESANGVLLDGRTVSSATEVCPGAVIQVGQTLMARAAPWAEAEPTDDGWVSGDPTTRRLLDAAMHAAARDLPLWIEGEAGTGKRWLAAAAYHRGDRATRQFVRVRCDELSEEEVSSALLGARREGDDQPTYRLGLIERAAGGTLLLEGIEHLNPTGVLVLEHVFLDGAVSLGGAAHGRSTDARVVTTTTTDAARTGDMGERARLCVWLRGAVLEIPPLRDRPRDVAPLARHLRSVAGDERPLGVGVMEALVAYQWPGNLRELRDALWFARSVAGAGEVTLQDLPRTVCAPVREVGPAEARIRRAQQAVFERNELLLTVTMSGNLLRAARALETSPSALLRALGRHGIDPDALGVGK